MINNHYELTPILIKEDKQPETEETEEERV